MEQKNTFHYDPSQTVTVRLLSELNPANAELPARIVNLTSKHVTLSAERSVRLTTAIRVDLDGGLLLGEVSDCKAEDDRFQVTVDVEQVIPSLSNLAKLMEAVMCASRAERPAHAADRRHGS